MAPVSGRARSPRSPARRPAAAIAGSLLALCTIASPASALPPPATSAGAVAPVVNSASLSGPTSWWALNRAIARIPNYRRTVVTSWVIDNAFGHYGATNMRTRRIHISRSVPPSRLFSVVAHEYAHALTVATYAGNRQRMNAGFARYFRAGAIRNREYVADCMARLLGAHWTHYTRCTNPRWRAAAAKLLQGRRL